MTRRLWIAVEAHLVSRDIVGHLRTVLGLSRAEAVGYLVMMWGQVAEDARGGDISGISDPTLEDWARWEGEAGQWAAFVRAHCVTDGVLKGWAEMQGPLEDRRERDRTRKAAQRAARKVSAGLPADVRRTSSRTEQNRTEQNHTTTTPPAKKQPAEDPRVAEVIAHYLELHPKRRPGPKERRIVWRALNELEYSVEDVKAAISGNAADQWHAERGKHELAYVLRDNGLIDDFRLRTVREPEPFYDEAKYGPMMDPRTGLPSDRFDLMTNPDRASEWARAQRLRA